jgi:hypothetical protein
MPEKSSALLERLGFELKDRELVRIRETVTSGDPLFPRLE